MLPYDDNTTKEQAASVRAGGPPRPALLATFVAGAPTFAVTPIGVNPTVVGRGTGSALVMPDERLSRQHFSVSHDGRVWHVHDLGSRNATYVNGQRIQEKWSGPSPRTLRAGQTVFLPQLDMATLAGPHALFDASTVVGPIQQAALDRIRQAARDGQSVLVLGETGVGKEHSAKWFHEGTQRRDALHTLNCAAVPEHLLESELFGHARGAFSGATQAHVGLFEAANGGTLFLDEVGEMPLPMQAKLLRVIQEREVRRVGETELRRIDVAIVAATNRDLVERMRKGQFREDLYYRLAQCVVHLPPLRERPEEISFLAAMALHRYTSRLAADASLIDQCLLRAWPGNVRELISAVSAAAGNARAAGAPAITGSSLPASPWLVTDSPRPAAQAAPVEEPIAIDDPALRRVSPRDQREATILEALRRNPTTDIEALAASVGASASTVYRILQRHGLGRR